MCVSFSKCFVNIHKVDFMSSLVGSSLSRNTVSAIPILHKRSAAKLYAKALASWK